MSSMRSKNVAVGLTVLVALGLLGAMVLMFAGMPDLFRGGYDLTIQMPSGGGVKSGDDVTLLGLRVGTVSRVTFASSDPRAGVQIKVHIDKGVKVPSNVTAYVSHGLMGGESIDLRTEGPASTEAPFVPTNGRGAIPGVSSGDNLIDEFRPVLKNLSALADSVNELINMPMEGEAGSEPTSQGTTGTGGVRQGKPAKALQMTLVNLNKTLASMNEILGDKENQQNIKGTLADLRTLTADARATMGTIQEFASAARDAVKDASVTIRNVNQVTTRAGEDIDVLAGKLIKDAEDISAVMQSMNSAIQKIDKGEGTAGKFLNDPKLYNNLVDVTNQMTSLMQDLRQLVQQWKENGVGVKLK